MGDVSWQILEGDVRDRLADLEPKSIQTCVTSPPYWGLRDYGTAGWEGGDGECDHAVRVDPRVGTSTLGGSTATSGHQREGFKDSCPRCGAKRIDSQLGLEPTPEEYVANLVAVFREVRRVLRDDGTVWLNLGDSYYATTATQGRNEDKSVGTIAGLPQITSMGATTYRRDASGLKPKDLVGIPWRVAFALQADGWWLRSDIIWNKPNPMPESVTDRPTRSHEYIFLLTKSARYFFDADAIRETDQGRPSGNGFVREHRLTYQNEDGTGRGDEDEWLPGGGRNKRSVWTVTTQPYAEAHFATFPPKLIEPCILAGAPPKCCGECGAPWERVTEKEATGRIRQRATGGLGTAVRREPLGLGAVDGEFQEGVSYRTLGWRSTCDHDDDAGRSTVIDPFAGSGTTGLVALRHDRSFIGIELNPDYCELARNRIRDDAPLLNVPLEA